MTKVFVGGSRRIGRLNADVRRRIDRIIANKLPVLIGDANGADKAVQSYLHGKAYQAVEVFCSSPAPRNNVGGWPIRRVEPAQRRRDFEYFAAKDRQMASEATVGLMLWDGQSRGTLLNVLRLVAQGKTVVVYVAPDKVFKDVRSDRDFDGLLSGLDHGNAARLQQQAVSEGLGRHLDREAQLRL